LRMCGEVGMHGINYANIVDVLCYLMENSGNFDSGFSVTLKCKWRLHQRALTHF